MAFHTLNLTQAAAHIAMVVSFIYLSGIWSMLQTSRLPGRVLTRRSG